MGTYRGLKPRHGAAECVAKLRDAEFTVWAFTVGDHEHVEGYFAQAGIDLRPSRGESRLLLPGPSPILMHIDPSIENCQNQALSPGSLLLTCGTYRLPRLLVEPIRPGPLYFATERFRWYR